MFNSNNDSDRGFEVIIIYILLGFGLAIIIKFILCVVWGITNCYSNAKENLKNKREAKLAEITQTPKTPSDSYTVVSEYC